MKQLIHKIELLELLVKGCQYIQLIVLSDLLQETAYHALTCGKQNKNSIILQISKLNVAMMPVAKVLVVAETLREGNASMTNTTYLVFHFWISHHV